MAVLERLQASDAGRDRGADPIRLTRDVQTGIALGQPGGGNDQMRKAVHPPCLLAIDELGRVEVLHLAGEVHRIPARVELGDFGGSRTTRGQVLPARLDIVAKRGDGAEAGDHDPSSPVEVCCAHIPSPPSTSSTSPVMNEASSEQRKRTARATSSGSPSRPSGVFESIAPRASSGSTSVRRVFTYPGATTFARTLRLPSSRASDFVKPMIPAFDAP